MKRTLAGLYYVAAYTYIAYVVWRARHPDTPVEAALWHAIMTASRETALQAGALGMLAETNYVDAMERAKL